MKSKRAKPTPEQKQLEGIQLERERQLTVERARETTRAFSDQIAFRRRLRGIFSLMSGGFKGFSGNNNQLGST